ncbi:lactonase family protein [Chloroflexi bacterium TSY]|nr:lactonase family protein [Chloroflexi bacterium TSY]
MPNHYAYIAIGGENKLLIFQMDPETGRLAYQSEVRLTGAPGPLAVDPTQNFLFVGLRSTKEIVTFRIDHRNGALSPHGTSVKLEADPCYLAADRSGRFLLSSYYGAGQVAVHPIATDGVIGQQPMIVLTTAEHAHCIQTDRSNQFVFVPHTVEPNAIYQFTFDVKTGMLTPNAVPVLKPPAGEGPRHFVFHPTKEFLYFSNENGSSVTAYRLDPNAGTLKSFQTLSTLPDGYRDKNTCAQIHIHPHGRFLYISNRGHDSIACFAIHEETGELTTLGRQSTEPIPRTFGLDPSGRFLYAAGQGSGRLAGYRIDPQSGLLHSIETYEIGERPMWVMILAPQI